MDEAFIGSIMLFPYDFSPRGWLPCEGQILPIGNYQALFSLLGTKFGGDGRSSFALPDLKDKSPAPSMKYYMAIEGLYPTRD